MTLETLLSPMQVGRYEARNRIFMAPMSRYRADAEGNVTDSTTEYYKQRATAGLIVAESTSINNWSGAIGNPGLFTAEHVPGWKKVTDAVHAEGGLVFVQLWHSGRATDTVNLPEGRNVVAPSAIASNQEVMTAAGMAKPPVPKALSLDEIAELRNDFKVAAGFAKEAGFDGVEIHAAGGFLIDTFLQPETNTRDDAYGGSHENRFRFLKEVVEDAIEIWDADRVAVKLSPTSPYNDMNHGDAFETFAPIYKALNEYGLAFLEVNQEMPFMETPEGNSTVVQSLRDLWKGVYVGNGNYSPESGEQAVKDGTASAITFGRFFLANPDLPKRFEVSAELVMPDMDKLYGGDDSGYIDYPALP